MSAVGSKSWSSEDKEPTVGRKQYLKDRIEAMTLDYTPLRNIALVDFFSGIKLDFPLPGLELPREACNHDMTIKLTNAHILL